MFALFIGFDSAREHSPGCANRLVALRSVQINACQLRRRGLTLRLAASSFNRSSQLQRK
jgi:hypothetical protein